MHNFSLIVTRNIIDISNDGTSKSKYTVQQQLCIQFRLICRRHFGLYLALFCRRRRRLACACPDTTLAAPLDIIGGLHDSAVDSMEARQVPPLHPHRLHRLQRLHRHQRLGFDGAPSSKRLISMRFAAPALTAAPAALAALTVPLPLLLLPLVCARASLVGAAGRSDSIDSLSAFSPASFIACRSSSTQSVYSLPALVRRGNTSIEHTQK